MPVTGVSEVGLGCGLCLNRTDSGFGWWRWRDRADHTVHAKH